jgi:hypothetical protein
VKQAMEGGAPTPTNTGTGECSPIPVREAGVLRNPVPDR